MTSLSGRRIILGVLLLVFSNSFNLLNAELPSRTPSEEQWQSFMEFNYGNPRLPEDETMGLLADRRNPDPLWSSALTVCDRAFSSIRNGRIPGDLSSAIRLPLSLDFEAALSGGGKDVSPRYALPKREGERLSVRVRLTGGNLVNYGFIYLVLIDGAWFLEQWALDLSGFPFVEGTNSTEN